MGKTKKGLKVLSIILLSIIVFVGVVLFGVRVWFKAPMISYYKASEQAFVIPGLNDNFVPQGFCYDAVETQYLVAGYDSKGEASSIYVVDNEDTNNVKRVALTTDSGEKFLGHCGGMTINGKYVYIADDTYIEEGSTEEFRIYDARVYVFSYEDIKSAQDGDEVKYLGYKEIKSADDYISVAFVEVHNGKLYLGQFHDGNKYKSNPNHKITSQNGDVLNALMVEYDLVDDESKFGIAENPNKAYAIPNKVQGVCFNGDYIYCSTSYGLAFSEIYKFDLTKASNEDVKTVLGNSIPLYALDNVALVNKYEIPPMSEEIVYKDGKLYVMSEFACNKYIMGKFADGQYCYATDLDKM